MVPTPLGPDGKPLPYMATSPLAHGITMAMWGAVSKKAEEERQRRLAEQDEALRILAVKVDPPKGWNDHCACTEPCDKWPGCKRTVTELVQGPDGVWRVPGCNSKTQSD